MTTYLISFPPSAMTVSDEDLPAVGEAAHAVVREAQAAGVLVLAGGLDDGVPPVLVAADGTTDDRTHPGTRGLSGGFTVVDVPTRDEAVAWAARIAAACRCDQELREFAPGSLP